ncbi:MAG: tRNA lysidine(34) synthetase TilS [Gammaproteobacteria bacterium]|nr:tRNA lysidine(34) synthetase TilS [Gammaproteobacteria bacterium]
MQTVIDEVVALTSGKRVWLAYSGGVDSHVLLHVLAQSNHPQLKNLAAIHVDHGLDNDSPQWTNHCADIAEALDVHFVALKVKVKNIDSLGVEAAAREARYLALQKALSKNDILLTAQHQQDQAETVLLQLFRGAGPKGLSAMARHFSLGDVHTIRPLLTTSKADILAYAQTHQLHWIDDPSNVETRWNRNYIRHKLWPDIVERWPSAAQTISRSAAHCAETSELLDDLAEQDCALLGIEKTSTSLPITALLALSTARCHNVLRHILLWQRLPLPSTVNLQRIIDEVCLAKQDSAPLVSWSGVEIRRYQDQLYFMPPLTDHDNKYVVKVDSFDDLSLDDGRRIKWVETEGQGLSKNALLGEVTVRFRQGGERIKPQGEPHHKTVKHLFQQWSVPPWQRERIPLIFRDDELVAIVGYCTSDLISINNKQSGYIAQLKL